MSSARNAQIIASWDAAQDGVETWSDQGDFAHQRLITPVALNLLGDKEDMR